LPGLHRIAIEFSERICVPGWRKGMTVMMAIQIRLPIRSSAFVSAFLISLLGVIGPTAAARAADCLTAPGASAPPNTHWYYRTDRKQQRKCWYLRAINGPSQEETVTTTRSVPAAPAAPHSLADFKDFLAHRGNANLSDKDVEQLYAEFLAWRRRPENEAKERQ
jgi:hypothetical protein